MKIPVIGIDPAFRKDGFRMVVIDEEGVPGKQEYTGREIEKTITYVFGSEHGLFGLPPGYCTMQLRPI